MIDVGDLVMFFMYLRTKLKVYHWQTRIYSRHIAVESLINKLDPLVDSMIEILQRDKEFKISSASHKFNNETDKSIIKVLNDSRTIISNIKKEELINIRDEMINSIDVCLYLFNFS